MGQIGPRWLALAVVATATATGAALLWADAAHLGVLAVQASGFTFAVAVLFEDRR